MGKHDEMGKRDEFPNVEWTDETREAFRRKRQGKNLVLLAVLLAFIVLVYIVALVRMGGG